jgi:hypothetical protein
MRSLLRYTVILVLMLNILSKDYVLQKKPLNIDINIKEDGGKLMWGQHEITKIEVILRMTNRKKPLRVNIHGEKYRTILLNEHNLKTLGELMVILLQSKYDAAYTVRTADDKRRIFIQAQESENGTTESINSVVITDYNIEVKLESKVQHDYSVDMENPGDVKRSLGEQLSAGSELRKFVHDNLPQSGESFILITDELAAWGRSRRRFR